MSESENPGTNAGKFEIELPDGEVLGKRDTVAHIDHGPMVVDQISVSAHGKRAQLQSELGPEGLQLTGEEIREQWGETLHFDPVKIHEQNPSVEMSGLSLPDSDLAVEADLKVAGDEMENVEVVAMYAKDRIVRAMQSIDRGEHPDDVDGIDVGFDWETILESRGE